jgi:hypothetical protein
MASRLRDSARFVRAGQYAASAKSVEDDCRTVLEARLGLACTFIELRPIAVKLNLYWAQSVANMIAALFDHSKV